jgi:surface antigen
MKRYSAQVSFTFLIAVFLTITVGEGQAYSIDTPKISAQLETQAEGFIGKPQLFAGQTILTGEVQQATAIVYTVEKGDSVVSIADRYGLNPGTVLDENNIDPIKADKIQPGTQLLIPAEDTNTSLAWLEKINEAKEEERRLAEAERQRQLASQRSSTTTNRTTSSGSSGYSVLTTLRGSYNGGYPGQCTWYANYKRPDLPNGMGNGGQYLASARAKGLATGSVPRVGSLIVTNESYYGHVGYVESVSGSSVTISEMNYVGPYVVSRRTISAGSGVIKGYVY